jgi:ATP-dependent exoDNAse (exonuclease V) beta subunit
MIATPGSTTVIDRVPSDAAARNAAVDIRRSVVAQAPAGSGKTTLLLDRYLRLLANADEPENVLVITFTRKAAAELRLRVTSALAQETHPAVALVRQRDRTRGWDIATTPHRLRIQTIDAFALSVAQRLPIVSAIGARVEFAHDARSLYRAAVDRVFSRLTDDPLGPELADVLAMFDNDYEALVASFCDMLAKRDQWLDAARAAIESASRSEGIERLLAHGIDTLTRDVIADVEHALGPDLLCELEQLAREAAYTLGHTFPSSLHPANAPAWRFVGELVTTQDGRIRRQVDVRQGFVSNGGRDAKARMHAALERLRAADLDDSLFNLRKLPDIAAVASDARRVAGVTLALSLAALELSRVFEQLGAIDFAELTFAARRALGSPEAPTDLALALDHRLSHILIDEFQDTSQSQLDLVTRLLDGWTDDDGRTFFAVGDPMQSIYRFRDAEVALMMRAARDGLGSVRPQSVRLQENFRSDPTLIDWINRVFPAAFGSADDPQLGRVAFASSVAARSPRPDAGVTVTFVDAADDAESEAALVVTKVVELKRRDPSGTIALLVRSRAHLGAILPALERAAIRWHGVDVEDATTHPVVRDLLVLWRALHDPHDRLAWSSLLRAPFVGLSRADLLVCADAHPVIDRLVDGWQALPLSADAVARLERCAPAIAAAFEDRDQRAPAIWLETTWHKLGGPDAYPNDDTEARAQEVFAALDATGSRQPNVETLTASMSRSELPRADRAAVEVMTIHRAKGLEFDHVLIPGLDRETRRTEPPLLLWRVQRDALLIATSASADSGLYEWLWREERHREAHERVRLLYVAATRARVSLHLFGCVPRNTRKPQPGSLLAAIFPGLEHDARWTPPATPAPISRAVSGLRLHADYARVPPAGAIPPVVGAPHRGSFLTGAESAVGSVIRRALRVLMEEPLPRDVTSYVEREHARWRDALLVTGGVADAERGAAIVARHVANVLGDARGRWLLSQRSAVDSEVRLAVHDGTERAFVDVDLTFVDETGVTWLVVLDTREAPDDAPELDRWLVVAAEPSPARGSALEGEHRSRAAIYRTAQPSWREVIA